MGVLLTVNVNVNAVKSVKFDVGHDLPRLPVALAAPSAESFDLPLDMWCRLPALCSVCECCFSSVFLCTVLRKYLNCFFESDGKIIVFPNVMLLSVAKTNICILSDIVQARSSKFCLMVNVCEHILSFASAYQFQNHDQISTSFDHWDGETKNGYLWVGQITILK